MLMILFYNCCYYCHSFTLISSICTVMLLCVLDVFALIITAPSKMYEQTGFILIPVRNVRYIRYILLVDKTCYVC